MLITFFICSAVLVCTQANDVKSDTEVDESSAQNLRIVNGTNVKLGERPFQVYLSIGRVFCGGAIINENYVLTAGHCMRGQNPNSVLVYVGTIDRTKPVAIHRASKLIVHENYRSPENDIALVKVEHPFTFSETVAPISLRRTNEILPSTKAYVSGWGGLGGPNSRPSAVLKMALVYVVDQVYCASIMQEINMPIYPSNICAFNPTLRRGHCNGDSGGPLTINGELAGIVSWSHKDPYCASTKYPNVYSRVSSFVDWIKKHTEIL